MNMPESKLLDELLKYIRREMRPLKRLSKKGLTPAEWEVLDAYQDLLNFVSVRRKGQPKP
jgi:hypothetical protein